MQFFFVLAFIYILVFILGELLEKIRIPWLFAALLIGLSFSLNNPFPTETASEPFKFLADLGMYFMLFMIGFEIDLRSIRNRAKLVVRTTFVILLLETLAGSLFIHFIFGYSFLISLIVATSFATVGEAVLLPILEEFKLVHTDLGQTIIGIGVLDDIVEVLSVVAVTILIGAQGGQNHLDILSSLGLLALLFALGLILTKLGEYTKKIRFRDIEIFFLVIVAIFYLFIGIGKIIEAEALAAILAGLALKNFIPSSIIASIESEIKTLAYAFFAPFFFIQIGLDTDFSYILKYPLYIISIMAMTKIIKIAGSYILTQRELGKHKAVILGVSLCVKFSSSLVILKILLEKGIIKADLYSILIGTTIVFKFLVPTLMAALLKKWQISPDTQTT